jgi:NAD+ synthase (glutamine-hydrolysing)
MRVALAQINPTVGDIAGNEAKVREQLGRAREAGAQLALFPELVVTGYPPEDLLLKEHFLADARAAVERIAADAQGIVAVVGFPERADDAYNAAAVLADGAVRAIYRKVNLPNYGVFDELRYFQRGPGGAIIEVDGVKVGLTICEDIWVPGPPMTDEALAGARLVLNISASPYQAGKGRQREQMIAQRARDSLAAVAFCALAGGQDELVFDGHSFVVDHDGDVIARAAQFAEELLVCDIDVEAAGAARLRDTRARPAAREMATEVADLGSFTTAGGSDSAAPGGPVAELLDADAEIYAALVLGTRDYVTKNGFEHVVLGLSGGIDSTLVALIAVDALGPERVTCVTMPSPYSSEGTQDDAKALEPRRRAARAADRRGDGRI